MRKNLNVALLFAIMQMAFIGSLKAQWTTTGTVEHLLYSTNTVGIGTTTPATKLDVKGDLNLSNGIYSYRLQGFKVLGFGKSSDITLVGRDAGGQDNLTGVPNIPCGSGHTVIGFRAGFNLPGCNVSPPPPPTDYNTFVGYNSGLNTTAFNFGLSEGSYNTFVGGGAGQSNTIGSFNTMLGFHAGANLSRNTMNTFVGYEAGYGVVQQGMGDENTLIGFSTGNYFQGNNNTMLGAKSMFNWGYVGHDNTFVGHAVGGSININLDQCTTLGANTAIAWGLGNPIINSSAIGYGATVCASNTMVFGNTQVTGWGFGVCPGANAFLVGVFGSGQGGNGATLTPGGVWTPGSAREIKEDFQKQDMNEILNKIIQLEVTKWKYKGTENEYHYGPMADDFYRLFEVGDGKSISDMDKTGVLFLGVQALYQENKELKDRLSKLEASTLRSGANSGALKLETPDSQTETFMLGQNIPNPSDNSTVIPFRIPENCNSASIVLYETTTGKLVTAIPISCHETHLLIEAGKLAAGTYSYSLYIDGQIMDTRQMVLTK